MTKTYQLSKGDILDAECSDGSKFLTFDHMDGGYAYLVTEKGTAVNLYHSQELVKKSNGHYEIK